MKYELWLGKFEKDEFIWKTVKEFEKFEEAQKYFRNFALEQVGLNNKELLEEHESTRLDIELRLGNKKLNWVGVYARKHEEEVDLNPDGNKRRP